MANAAAMFSYEFKVIRLTGIATVAMLLAISTLATTSPIVPLPQQFQSRPGVFTLCPSQPMAAAPGHPLVKIYADPATIG